MNIDITSRHFSASKLLKELVHKKIKKIEKYNSDIMYCNVILIKEHKSENVEIVAHAKGNNFTAHEQADLFEKSLVNAIEKISIQIKKKHGKALAIGR